MEETRCRSTSRKSQDQNNLRTTRDFFAMKKLQGSVGTTCREKNEAEQLTAQAKTEAQIFPEPWEESTGPNAGPKTEGPGQTSPPKKRKGRLEKEISKADRKTSKKKNKRKDLRSTPERGGSRKSRGKEERRSEQSTKKEASEKAQTHQDQTDPGEREEKKNKNKSDRRESAKNVTKASATWPKRWKRKTKPKLGNGRTACPHHKPIQREAQTPLNYQQTLEVERKENPSKKSKKPKLPGQNKSCKSQAKTTRTREREPPQDKETNSRRKPIKVITWSYIMHKRSCGHPSCTSRCTMSRRS